VARRDTLRSEIERLQTVVREMNEDYLTLNLEDEKVSRDVSVTHAQFCKLAQQHVDMAALEANLMLERDSSIFVANAGVLPSSPTNALNRTLSLVLGLAAALVAGGVSAILYHEIRRIRSYISSAGPATNPDASSQNINSNV
jgi:hypothetical protein